MVPDLTLTLFTPFRLYRGMQLFTFLFGAYFFGLPKESVSLEVGITLMALAGFCMVFAAISYTRIRYVPENYRLPIWLTSIMALSYMLLLHYAPGNYLESWKQATLAGPMAVFVVTFLFFLTLSYLRAQHRKRV